MKVLTELFPRASNGGLLNKLLFVLIASISVLAQSPVQIAIQPGHDIGSEINAAIGHLSGENRVVQLPAGSFIQTTPVKASGNAIRIIGSPSGTTLKFNPSGYSLLDSADSAQGWTGSGARVWNLNAFGEDHPDPMEGSGYIAVNTNDTMAAVAKSIAPTDFTRFSSIGTWLSLNLTNEQTPIQFYVSDGSNTAYWTLTPASIYATWKFTGLDRAKPTGNDGRIPNMARITTIGFRNLSPHVKYFFDAISLYTPSGPSIRFSACNQCSLENVRIQWEPAADADAVVLADQGTRRLTLHNVHTMGGGGWD